MNETAMPTAKTDKGSEIAAVKAKADGMQGMLDTFQVVDDDSLNLVADKIKQVKALQKYIEQEKDKYTAPAKQIIAEAKEQYDPYILKCKNAEITLKERAKGYMVKKEQERIAAEQKLAARVEKGTMKPETAMRKMEELPEAQKTVRTDAGAGLRMSKRKVAKIVDMNLIPDEFWIVDDVKVRRAALERERSGMEPIPGVVVVEETDLASV